MRSPRTAPPETGLDGSTAATATLWPRVRKRGDIGVDQCRLAGAGRTGKADHRRAADARTDAPINAICGSAAALHQGDARASVDGSPAASRSMKSSCVGWDLPVAAPAQTTTRGWPKPSSRRRQPTISPWVTPASAASTIRSKTFSRSLLAARASASSARRTSPGFALLEGLEARDVPRHARRVGPLGRAATVGPSSF